MCKHIDPHQGGLGPRSLLNLNGAYNLKFCWNVVSSHENWALLLKGKAIGNNAPFRYHIHFTIWCKIKNEYNNNIISNSSLIGRGSYTNFWLDYWHGPPLIVNIHPSNLINTRYRVADFVFEGSWNFLGPILSMVPNLLLLAKHVTIPLDSIDDCKIWNHNTSHHLIMKDSYEFKYCTNRSLFQNKHVWNYDIPSKNFLFWWIYHNKRPTNDHTSLRGCCILSMYNLWKLDQEYCQHFFFRCPFFPGFGISFSPC